MLTFYMVTGDLNSAILAYVTNALTPNPILGFLVKVKTLCHIKPQLNIPQVPGMVTIKPVL